MTPTPNRLWPVRFDLDAWEIDLRAASAAARGHAERWRLRIDVDGGIREHEFKPTRANDNAGLDLPACVKTRIPNPAGEDPLISPWGAVLVLRRSHGDLVFVVLAFGLRHPPHGSRQPSVYERAHRRLHEP
jgi:hypothetical protein